jgi:predicted DNA-binding transcriptional regulator YafY
LISFQSAWKRRDIADWDGEEEQSSCLVQPIQLGFMARARVLAAWCQLCAAFRFFRTDRILSAVEGDRYPGRRVDLLRDFRAQLNLEDQGRLLTELTGVVAKLFA